LEANKISPSEAYVNDLQLFTTGTNFWQSSLLKHVSGLTVEQALYKPSPERHGIWQIVRHIAYWKYWALTYLTTGEKLNAKEDDWAPMPDDQSQQSWDNEIANLSKLNDRCLEEAGRLGDSIMTSTEEKVIFFRQLLYHDCYHTGQIGFLRAMQGIKPVD
jgi:hypothetical protein